MVELIPLELRQAPQWVVAREDAVPLNVVTGRAVDPTNPLSWGTFDQAVATGLPHLGFCLSHGDPYTVIDLDDKLNKPATDEQRAFFAQLIEAFGSYTEISRSGRGYHIIVRGRIPAGRRCDKKRIEVYTADRYFILTGNVLPGKTTIVDGQKGIDWLLANVLDSTVPGQSSLELDTCKEQPDSDQEMLNKMCSASNSEKVIGLWQGNWQQYGYPSQSEADMALMDILCHYSPNDEQCRRMFRFSALGQRDKAKRDAYLNYMLRKKRVEQLPVDYTMLLPIPAPKEHTKQLAVTVDEADQYEYDVPASHEDVVVRQTTQGTVTETFAPGALGWLQWYSYCSAERPAVDISLVAAMGFLAGLCGRAYNIGGTGLNQYLLLLAPTGTGKDELAKFPERIIRQTADMIPSIKEFRGPGTFASGQALIKQLCKSPCFSSVLGEFGHTIKHITDPKASTAQEMMRKVLLLLYGSSGADGTLQPMAYSDADKSTNEVKSPALTIVGETVPDSFFAAMSNEQVENGLLPRFLTLDYRGARPPSNPNSGISMPTEMRNWLVELASICLTQGQRGTAIEVGFENEQVSAYIRKAGAYDQWCDELINASTGEVARQLWNRAHLKAIRLSALIAAASNPHKPVITREYAEWAANLVTKDTQTMIGRFEEGVGEGDAKQLSDLRTALWQYKDMTPQRISESYRIPEAVSKSGMIPFAFLQRKLANVTSFRKDKRGSTQAIQAAIATLVATGEIAEAPREKCLAIGYSGKLYIVNFGK